MGVVRRRGAAPESRPSSYLSGIMGLAQDALAAFMAIVATVNASIPFERRAPVAATSRNQETEAKVLEVIKQSIEHTEQAVTAIELTVKPTTTLKALSLRDGAGTIRTVLLLETEVPRVLRFARTAGIIASPAAAGVQMLEFSLRFADVDFYAGVQEIARRTSAEERARAKRGESSSGNAGVRRGLEELERQGF